MRSRRYNKRIVPVRKVVSLNSGIKIINGKPRNFRNVEKKSRRFDSSKIKYAKIIEADDNVENCADNHGVHSIYLVNPRPHHTVFLITMEDGTKLRHSVQTGSRNYYFLLQYLKANLL